MTNNEIKNRSYHASILLGINMFTGRLEKYFTSLAITSSMGVLRRMLLGTKRFLSLIEIAHFSLKIIHSSLAITSSFSNQFILSVRSSKRSLSLVNSLFSFSLPSMLDS